jgi:ankyrin repeat protein
MKKFWLGGDKSAELLEIRDRLIWLCSEGVGTQAVAEVNQIISTGLDLTFIDKGSDLTPLLLALDSKFSDPNIALDIFKYSSKPLQRGKHGFSTIHGAAKSEIFLEILTSTLREGADVNEYMHEESDNTALSLAMMFLNENGARTLIKHGANVNASRNAAAAGWAGTQWIGHLQARSKLHTYLENPIKLDACLILLLEAGLDLNCYCNYTFKPVKLINAAISEWNLIGRNIFFPKDDTAFQSRKLLLLLENGADPNAYSDPACCQGYSGSSIHYCRRAQQLIILLKNGADPHQVDSKGYTILHSIAASKDFHPDLKGALESCGFSVTLLAAAFDKRA